VIQSPEKKGRIAKPRTSNSKGGSSYRHVGDAVRKRR
jgi:hypothetical protein